MDTIQAQQPITLAPTRPVAPEAAPRRSPGRLVLALASMVAVAGLAFAGGRLTAPAVVASVTGGTAGGQGSGFGPGNGTPPDNLGGPGGPGLTGGSMSIAGTVAGVSATSITVTLASGSTVEIPIDSSTTYHAATAATAADVTTGSTVTVQVSRTSGGSGATGGSGVADAIGTATDVTITTP